jgi:predicted DNA-binding transcriptional regulator YafY
MNRTDRLYAIVEELRAVAPRPRSATWLATRFEVSARTIERDVSALQQSGTPIWAEPGRTGGYCLDASRTLPPINLTPSEAVAIAVALESTTGTPFALAALSAARKVVAAMNEGDSRAARELVGRIHVLGAWDDGTRGGGSGAGPGRPEVSRPSGETPDPAPAAPVSTGPAPAAPVPVAPVPAAPVPSVIADALTAGRVLRIGYRDKHGALSSRDIEPVGYVGNQGQWYLVAWCRLREGIRAFRVDRIASSVATAEVPEPRAFGPDDLVIPYGQVRRLSL